MATLLEKMEQERLQGRERLRAEVRRQLREVLPQTIPGQRVVVFGSLAKPGRFSEGSDIDLALESEPPDMSLYQLTSLLAEPMGHKGLPFPVRARSCYHPSRDGCGKPTNQFHRAGASPRLHGSRRRRD